jgi:hypothetical protein
MLTRPYHQRPRPSSQSLSLFAPDRIDLSNVHLPDYPIPDPSGFLPDSRPLANSLFDGRAAAAVSCGVGDLNSIIVKPISGHSDPNALLERKDYGDLAPTIYIPTAKCLAVMAFADYFPTDPNIKQLRTLISDAIMEASPGWCGTFGPGVSDHGDQKFTGDYDMTLMFLLPLAYNYYCQLRPEAREKVITLLLARGRIHRASIADDVFTSGGAPNDWSRAGYVSEWPGVNLGDIPETENHVLMIATARYLTNQLLYQRDRDPSHDNRRNGCLEQLRGLLRNYLGDDFAEYNAKNYQEQTRHALLNLCSYAYDAEVRLGARMVLDYISAHIVVSSNDLRRMVPFRRRNEGINVNLVPGGGFMDVGLLDASATGADPMPAQFALLAGNTRAYRRPNYRIWPGEAKPARPWEWAITSNFGTELGLGAVSDYRLPPSVHDLFVNDLHRRFFQRIHRHLLLEEAGQQRNCDNMEIYASSPSYLITAGGRPARWVIPGEKGRGYYAQNLGVAVPISFMPTGLSAWNNMKASLRQLAISVGIPARPMSLKAVAGVLGISAPFSLFGLFMAKGFHPSFNDPKDLIYPSTNDSRDLIQLLQFSDDAEDDISGGDHGGTENYGVAPDFACGFAYWLPGWTGVPMDKDGIWFVNRKSNDKEFAGFFLAIIKWGLFVVLEAFDTWRHPEVTFCEFQGHVREKNSNIQFHSGLPPTKYTTYYGNVIDFVIWHSVELDNHIFGSKILNIEYAAGDPGDTLVEAGNYPDQTRFLDGTILKSGRDAVTEIDNPHLGTRITLDWSDPSHLVRISEDGEIEEAGKNATGQLCEVWVDFDWNGPFEGDFFHPFNRLASAVDAVADGGVIKIAPGTTHERFPAREGRRIKLVAPIGDVTIGAR